MARYIDRNLGPLAVTEDMRTIGLNNTFLAGYFAPGSVLLQDFQTPANQRTDISTDPDRYNHRLFASDAIHHGAAAKSTRRCAHGAAKP